MLLRLGDAHEEAEAAFVEEALLQPLKEELPLTERVTVPTPLTDGEKEVDRVSVPCGLPVEAPLPVDK